MALYHSPRISMDGLESMLDAGNVKSYPGSGATFYDLTGKGNHGTLITSPAYVTDYGGGFVFLKNVSRRITVTTTGNMIVTPTDSFSIVAVFEASELNTRVDNLDTHCAIYGRGATVGSHGIGFRRLDATGNLEIFAGTRAVSLIAETYPIERNQVYHVVLTYTPTVQKLFVNGAFISDSDTSAGVAGTFDTDDWGIFSSSPVPGGNGSYADAKFYLGMFYSRELTAAEVLANFHAFSGRFGLA